MISATALAPAFSAGLGTKASPIALVRVWFGQEADFTLDAKPIAAVLKPMADREIYRLGRSSGRPEASVVPPITSPTIRSSVNADVEPADVLQLGLAVEELPG